VPLAILDRRMQTAGGPGIIPFELAGPRRSAEILRRWGTDGQRAARASLILDFPFLVAYTTLGLRLTGQATDALGARWPRLARLGPAVAAVQVAAGALDAVENSALLGVVARGGDARLAALAQKSARAKFAGLLAGWVFGGVALAGMLTGGE
jgi:hypothetical protein